MIGFLPRRPWMAPGKFHCETRSLPGMFLFFSSLRMISGSTVWLSVKLFASPVSRLTVRLLFSRLRPNMVTNLACGGLFQFELEKKK